MDHHSNPIEAGHPTDDPRAFRRSLGQFGTGVTVVTAQHEGHLVGMAVNSFSAVSLDPPLVLWSIRKQSGSLSTFRDASHFAVNVLALEQVQTSALFGSSEPDKFARADWQAGLGGAPLLQGCIATFECHQEQLVDGGDHWIVIGRVERHARYAGAPLLFAQGRYAMTQDIQDTTPSGVQNAAGPGGPVLDNETASWLRLLHYSSHELSACFAQHREAEGLGVAAFRILSWLRVSSRTLEELQRLTYLGERDALDTLKDLELQQHVQRDAAGRYGLTTLGRQRADASARRVAAFEIALTRDIPAADAAVTRKVLGHLAQCSQRL